jgi:hypothetical protein
MIYSIVSYIEPVASLRLLMNVCFTVAERGYAPSDLSFATTTATTATTATTTTTTTTTFYTACNR